MKEMSTIDFGVDIEACRENLRKRQRRRFQEREALRQAAREAISQTIREILPLHPDVRQVYLFGSVTLEGQFGDHSDIDVAVEGTNAEQYFDLWRDLEKAAPDWFIDLREINEPSHFVDRVRKTGELIYERSD